RRSLSPRTCFTFTPSTPPPISTLSLHDALPIFYQRFRLIGIRLSKLIERDGVKCRITNIGRDRRGNGEGTHRPGNESARSRLFRDRKSTRLNSSHVSISYAVFCLKKKKQSNSTS